MDLYLFRHGIAVERGLPGYEDDSQRPLTPKGAARIYRIAQAMERMGIQLDVVLSSPYVRTQQTAQILASLYKMEDRFHLTETLAPTNPPSALVGEIHELYAGTLSIVVVGHEPYLGALASMLLTGDEKVAMTFKKGGLCKFSVDELIYGRCATLDWLITPKQMLNLD